MSWRFRKSFTVIPGVRLNLTSRGLSTTIGAAPFSVNIGPNGVYRNVSIPGTGIWERTRIDTPSPKPSAHTAPKYPLPFAPNLGLEAEREIRSAGTDTLTSDTLEPMRQLLSQAYKQRKELSTELAFAASDSSRATERYQRWQGGFLLKHLFKATLAAHKEVAETAEAKLRELEEQHRLSAIRAEIGLEPDQQGPYTSMLEKFVVLTGSKRIWNILAERSVNRVVERSNVNTAVRRTPVSFGLGECDLIEWGQEVPRLQNLTGGEMFIYPGFVLYRASTEEFALIDFQDIKLGCVLTDFTDTDPVPPDSRVIGYTWAKCNKDGSPDRRFRDNCQIPIARYGGLYFTSVDGLDVRYLISNAQAAQEFTSVWNEFQRSFKSYAHGSQPSKSNSAALPPATPEALPAHSAPKAKSAPSQNDTFEEYRATVTEAAATLSAFLELQKQFFESLRKCATTTVNAEGTSFTFPAKEMSSYLDLYKDFLGRGRLMKDRATFLPATQLEAYDNALSKAEQDVVGLEEKANTRRMKQGDVFAFFDSVAEFLDVNAAFFDANTNAMDRGVNLIWASNLKGPDHMGDFRDPGLFPQL